MKSKRILPLVFWCMASTLVVAQDLRGDMSLAKLLIPGAGWELVADGLGFADGPCSDADGNFYFSDMRKGSAGPGIFRIGRDGSREKLLPEAASGLYFGPDGRLFACQGRDQIISAFDLSTRKKEVIAKDVQPNDLVISDRGHLYYTETRKKRVVLVDLNSGRRRTVAEGIAAPNGIALSADGGTLAVSDFRGRHVWAYRVEADGSLGVGEPFMTMRTTVDPLKQDPQRRGPVYRDSCRGDGMGSDLQGRWFVATELGVQFFDPLGRISGVIPNPGKKGMTSVALAGSVRAWLYVTCGDTIFRRKVNATGTLSFRTGGN